MQEISYTGAIFIHFKPKTMKSKHISGQLAHSIALKDMKSEGYIILNPKKVVNELPVHKNFEKAPKIGFKFINS